MKKNLPIIILGLFVIGLGVIYYVSKSGAAQAPIKTTTPVTEPLQNSEAQYTAEQVEPHNNEADCWVIVKNSVYNVTALLAEHPAGPKTILPFCGADGTDAFYKRPDGSPHSDGAIQTLETFKIGKLAL